MSNQFNDIKSIIGHSELSLTSEKYNTLIELLNKAEEDSFYNRIGLLFDNCDRIRSNIELLEGMSESVSASLNTNGIVYSKKIKLFLLGDFSSGKTTFVKRLLSKSVGVSSQFPQTSSIIRHFGSSSKMRMIMPCRAFTPRSESKFAFKDVIRKFDLDRYFIQQGDTWRVEDESISITDWQDTRLVDFIGAIDSYPGFIEGIDWGHKLSDKMRKYSLLDYADIYDVPGIGGEVEHDDIIAKALSCSPDIIVYLIDPSRGIPGEDEERTLIKIALSNSEAHFVWCYQKSIDNKSVNFSEEQERELGIFVANMIDKAKDNQLLPSELITVSGFFDKAKVVDATGDIDDSFSAVDSVTDIISRYFSEKTQNYISCRKAELTGIPQFPKILGMNDPKRLIAQKLSALVSQDDVRRKHLGNLLDEVFESELLADYLKKHEDSKFAAFMHEKISGIVALIVSKSIQRDGSNILEKYLWNSVIDENEDFQLNLNFLKRGFEQLHASNFELQVAIPLVQAYILYVLFSDKRLDRIYRKDIESHIIKQVEQDLGLLRKGISV